MRNPRSWFHMPLALIVFCFLAPRALTAQELKPDEVSPRYRLIQVVEPSSLHEKINEAAGEGYRLIAASLAPGASMAVIMERLGTPSGGQYRYLVMELRNEQQYDQQLNDEGAKGFRLQLVIKPVGPAVLELAPGVPKPHHYVELRSFWGGLNEKKTSELVNEGYEMVDTAPRSLARMALIFENKAGAGEQNVAHLAPKSSFQPSGPAMQPLHRYRFLRGGYGAFPKKELLKAAARGDRLIRVLLWTGEHGWFFAAAVEEAVSPTAPYEYRVLEPVEAGFWKVTTATSVEIEEDLNRAGAEGFRLFHQNLPFLPFVMEKAPGSSKHFQYRFLVSARLSDLSEKLEDASRQGYEVVAMIYSAGIGPLKNTIGVVMEGPPQPADGK